MPTYEAVTPLVAFVGFTSSGDFEFASPAALKVLDGIEYIDEDFVEYMDPPLSSVVQRASGIRLSRNDDNGQVVAITHFETSKELNETELTRLKEYYDGQMSDGIGENLLSEIQNRLDVQFRLEVFGLYESAMGSQLRKVK